MARVTVEDCVDKVPNRFELVLLSAHRSRQISAGASISIDRDNDKNPVVALREIADEELSPGDLREDLIHSLQRHVEVDEPEEAINAEEAAEETTAEQPALVAFDTIPEEDLLASLQGLVAPERTDDM